MTETDAIHHTKNRIVAVDIARIMAAVSVLYMHLKGSHAITLMTGNMGGDISRAVELFPNAVFGSISTVFLLFAGYFACRNISWIKALKNSLWSFIPFVIWNALCIVCFLPITSLPEDTSWYNWFGINSFILPQFAINPDINGFDGYTIPVNGSLWFMRDLVFLFLLSPVLFKVVRVLFPALLLISFIPSCSWYFSHECYVATMSPYSITYFSAGCFLNTLSKHHQNKLLAYYNPFLICSYCLVSALIAWYREAAPTHLCHMMLSIWVFYQIARWIEVKIPQAKTFALRFAPVTFLTFAAHWLIYPYLPLKEYDLVLLYPILVFALCSTAFFMIKRWARPLLLPLAHYKLRPDDLLPKA